jgi:hypothetical protein
MPSREAVAIVSATFTDSAVVKDLAAVGDLLPLEDKLRASPASYRLTHVSRIAGDALRAIDSKAAASRRPCE